LVAVYLCNITTKELEKVTDRCEVYAILLYERQNFTESQWFSLIVLVFFTNKDHYNITEILLIVVVRVSG